MQLIHFLRFISKNGLAAKLKAKDWSGFAKGYNGPGYSKNKYDVRIGRAYDAYKKYRLNFSFILVVCIFFTGCANSQSRILTFDMQSQYEEIPSLRSPVGKWVTDLQYPIFKSADGRSTEGANISVLNHIESYKCVDGGDLTYSASNIRFDGKYYVYDYEVMWMCSTMPSPDYDSGVFKPDFR